MGVETFHDPRKGESHNQLHAKRAEQRGLGEKGLQVGHTQENTGMGKLQELTK